MKIASILLILLASCNYKTVPLKNTYQNKPYEITSSANFNTVWDKVIDVFSQKGIGIKLIDRSSGLIVAHNATIPVTHEDSKGNLVNPNAWVVSAKVWEPGANRYYYPETGSVEWNIRIKDLGGSTSINVNITNIVTSTAVTQVNPVFALSNTSIVNTNAVSTGVFEKMISDLIK